MLDDDGTDAIWIQERGSAGGAGHSGLMVQDYDGQWWYFYWGPVDETFRFAMFFGVPAGGFCVPINVTGELKTVGDVQNAIDLTFPDNDTKNGRYNRSIQITDIIYFTGDYTATFEVAKMYAENEKKASYNLLFYNCVELTLSAFFASNELFSTVVVGDLTDAIPNIVFSRVKFLFTSDYTYPERFST